MHRPSIEEIAARTPHLLVEGSIAQGGNYNIGARDSGPVPGNMLFQRDEIDVFGDGSVWASCTYQIEYTGSRSGGDRITPGATDFDISDVRVDGVELYDNRGNELNVPEGHPQWEMIEQALLSRFWEQDAHSDRVAELIYADMS